MTPQKLIEQCALPLARLALAGRLADCQTQLVKVTKCHGRCE